MPVLFDFCVGANGGHRFANALLLQLLEDLAAHCLERRDFCLAGVVQTDDVPAELGFHRRLGVLAFLQAGQRFGKFLDEVVGVGPVQIAALLG
jgi:hypothetical protein